MRVPSCRHADSALTSLCSHSAANAQRLRIIPRRSSIAAEDQPGVDGLVGDLLDDLALATRGIDGSDCHCGRVWGQQAGDRVFSFDCPAALS